MEEMLIANHLNFWHEITHSYPCKACEKSFKYFNSCQEKALSSLRSPVKSVDKMLTVNPFHLLLKIMDSSQRDILVIDGEMLTAKHLNSCQEMPS